MNSQSNAMPESFGSPGIPLRMSATQPLYWSVMRELWENRSIYVAPLVVAGVALVGFFLSLIVGPHRMIGLSALTPAQQSAELAKPYSFSAALMMFTAIVVGIFYCLDALHGERKDRSILFWKSLPVSDLTTVVSKESIPVVILPLVVFVITIAMQLTMVLMSVLALLMSGISPATLWAHVPLFQIGIVLLYGVSVHAVWQAPVYAWLLLVSGWAKRMAFLWAAAPLLAIWAIDAIVFHTSHLGGILSYLFFGGCMRAYQFNMQGGGDDGMGLMIPLSQLTPGRLLSYPGLWIGLIVTAGLLVAAARLRRSRQPI